MPLAWRTSGAEAIVTTVGAGLRAGSVPGRSWAVVPWCQGDRRRMLGLMDGNDRGERVTAPGAPRQTRGSVPIGRIWHVEIRLHWTFLALLFLVLWLYSGAGRRAVAADLLWIAAIFGSVLVHELAHCVVARRRGAVVDDILLTPLGGLSQLHEMPEAPGDELAIAIVGPLTNFVLAVGLTVGGLVTGARLWAPTLFAGSWFARLLWMNVLLGAFNLLPALPMDGGRVLRAALARRYDRYTATAMAAHVARVRRDHDPHRLLVRLLVDPDRNLRAPRCERGGAGSQQWRSPPARPGDKASRCTATDRHRRPEAGGAAGGLVAPNQPSA